ncbi:MAG: hypothetical protein GX994_07030, partial [Firmicutes bacterium]|nr:hypothetical protein [Bacillota bacterium]
MFQFFSAADVSAADAGIGLNGNGADVFNEIEALKDQFPNITPFTATATSNTNLRRPVSPEQPMWLVHIDTWNWADPQKIIDLIPEDILPYVVFNISLSINWDDE